MVSRKVWFSAAHRIYSHSNTQEWNRDQYGKCSGLHGHNYGIKVSVCGVVNPISGYVMDLRLLDRLIAEAITNECDHSSLEDVEWLNPPLILTSENLVVAFWNRLKVRMPQGVSLHKVTLTETNKNKSSYSG